MASRHLPVHQVTIPRGMPHLCGCPITPRVRKEPLNADDSLSDTSCLLFMLASFILMLMVFFSNLLATYIGVAQPYHTIRLMTSGWAVQTVNPGSRNATKRCWP
eukprot:5529065-Amphidinium_carterae.1